MTENTRGAYPLEFIDNAVPSGVAGHPTNVVMLTADAFGVLPPIARLSPAAAMYHFLSGYTAKVAGTERGVTEPKATFSTCFGAPFMVWDPNVYAKLLGERIAKHKAHVWLVNTGWTGGPYGVGTRMKIAHTRAMIDAALSGELDRAGFQRRSRSSTSTCRRAAPTCRPTVLQAAQSPGRTRRPTTRRRRSSRRCSSRTSRRSKRRLARTVQERRVRRRRPCRRSTAGRRDGHGAELLIRISMLWFLNPSSASRFTRSS